MRGDQAFSADEMLAIREQYEERIAQAEQRREELEWSLRMELARIRSGEAGTRRAVDELRRVAQTLQALLGDPAEVNEPQQAPLPLTPIMTAGPNAITPPPPPLQPVAPQVDGGGLPTMPRRASSNLETFTRAMGRKRSTAAF
jgi:hypothetical protein